MKPSISEAEFEFLLRRAGLSLSDQQKKELLRVYPLIEAMAEKVRKPRGREAEPAHIFTFAEGSAP